MGNRHAEIVFTPSVKRIQEAKGSRRAYARLERGPDSNAELGEDEVQFITSRDNFFLASTGETGWPYVQHRGGPVGFLKARTPLHKSRPESGMHITVVAFDWNCPQYITPRYTENEIGGIVRDLKARIASLEAQLKQRSE